MNYPETGILNLAIMEMAKRRGDKTFCPSEVVRWIYPNDWRHFMDEVREAMMDLYRKGLVDVTQKSQLVDKNFLPVGPVRIVLKREKNE